MYKRGTVLKDTYTVDAYLGAGAYGDVYKVRHRYLGMQAFKILKPNVFENETEIFNEAFLLSKLTHDNVVRVYEANTFSYGDRTETYIAMEYVNGGSLDVILKQFIRLQPAHAVSIQMGICRGLWEAHKLTPPIIHRDIKPHNILLKVEGERLIPKVSDFGVARLANPDTKMTDVAGTLAFLPPEGFWDYQLPASDVFSAGIVFYFMLTGVAPFPLPRTQDLSTLTKIKEAIRKSRLSKPPPPSRYNRAIKGELDELVGKSLRESPKDRYSDAGEFLKALREYSKSLDDLSSERELFELYGAQRSRKSATR